MAEALVAPRVRVSPSFIVVPYELPHLFDVDARPIYKVKYIRAPRCDQCGSEITEATLFGHSTLFKDEEAPYCLNRGCAIDAAYSRPDV